MGDIGYIFGYVIIGAFLIGIILGGAAWFTANLDRNKPESDETLAAMLRAMAASGYARTQKEAEYLLEAARRLEEMEDAKDMDKK